MKFLKNRKGFTLIELLVVISIIGVLASIVLGALGEAREKATIARLKIELNQFEKAIELYHIDNGFYPNRENGLTHQNANIHYLYTRATDTWDSDFVAKMAPYYDMQNLTDTLKKRGANLYEMRYTPMVYCGSGNSTGNLAQTWSVSYNTIRWEKIIPEHFRNTSGSRAVHCIRPNIIN